MTTAPVVDRRLLTCVDDLEAGGATRAEILHVVRQYLTHKQHREDMDAERAALIAEDLAAIRLGDQPTIGLYRHRGIKPAPQPMPDQAPWMAADPETRVPPLVRELARHSGATVKLREALGAVADRLLAVGADPGRVKDAFASCLTEDRP